LLLQNAGSWTARQFVLADNTAVEADASDKEG
jgi:hypothetical protein